MKLLMIIDEWQVKWMNDLLVVYFEKEIFLTIDNEAILQRFQNMSMRRN